MTASNGQSGSARAGKTEFQSAETESVAPSSTTAGKARARPIMLLIICGIALIAAIAIGTATVVLDLRDRALADSKRELSNIALLVAKYTDQEIEELEQVENSVIERIQSLGNISSENFERNMSGEDVHVMLKDKISGLSHVAHIIIVDTKGNTINSSIHWPAPAINVADRNYFKIHKSEAQLAWLVSEPIRNHVSGTWVTNISRKLTAPNGEFLGLIAGAIELQYFENFFESIALRNDTAINMFHRDGTLLARYPHIEPLIGRSFVQSPLFQNIVLHSDHGAMRLEVAIDGQDRLIAAQNLRHYPITIGVATTVAAALANWQTEAIFLIGAGMLAALLVAAIVFVIVRQLLQGKKRFRQELTEQKLQLDIAVSNMSQGLLLFDSSKRVVLFNRRYIEMHGLSPGVVKPGCTIHELIRHRKETGSFLGDVEQYCAELDAAIAQGTTTSRIVETTGGRSIQIVNQPMAGGGWVATHEDITERRRAEQERDRNREFLDLVIENIPSTIVVKDAHDLRYILLNRAGEKYFGLSRDAIIGKKAHDFLPPASADFVTGLDKQLLQTHRKPVFNEHVLETSGGTRIAMSKRLAIVDDNGKPRYLLAVVDDITERKEAEARIAHMAHHDALTDLPNRALLRERLEQELSYVRRGGQLAVLYLDIDNFKSVNDTLGHSIGDELLKAMAERLRGCLRDTDIIARLGGDEFAIVQAGLEDPTEAAILAQRLRDVTIQTPYELNGHQIAIDVSIGIALAPSNGTELDQLLKNADMALYGAKSDGRGTYRYFAPEMDARMKTRRAFEVDLRKALVNGEFELHYQPLVNLQNNKVSGCEALLRWRHPERGIVSPVEFIPVAEEIGLINVIGEWVLRQACADAATWPDGVKVAVNLSPAQFRNQCLTQTVLGILAASGLPPQRLELEITESVLMQNNDATLDVLHQLRGLGVRIAMDDFGTGYSSLSYLRSFPFNKIKIDRSFIKDISSLGDSLKIVQAIAGLASGLGMTTTAEGVETECQLELIRAAGCTEMQGYLFSRPRPVSEIYEFFAPGAEKTAQVA